MLKMVWFFMHYTFVRTLSIESGNSNLLILKRKIYLKFRLTKGGISIQPGFGD